LGTKKGERSGRKSDRKWVRDAATLLCPQGIIIIPCTNKSNGILRGKKKKTGTVGFRLQTTSDCKDRCRRGDQKMRRLDDRSKRESDDGHLKTSANKKIAGWKSSLTKKPHRETRAHPLATKRGCRATPTRETESKEAKSPSLSKNVVGNRGASGKEIKPNTHW